MTKLLIWDLDDTLLDTTKDIVPQALIAILRDWKRLKPDFSESRFHQRREELLPSLSNREIFKKLAQEFQFSNPQAAFEMAVDHFYHPRLNYPYSLLPGALENLKALQKKNYQQVLLTAGDETVQLKKIDGVGIRDYFSKIFVADINKTGEKDSFFSHFPKSFNVRPEEILSIGNRRHSEIRHAKQVGCKTCLFQYGEHADEPIEIPADQPDFQVISHQELIATCKL